MDSIQTRDQPGSEGTLYMSQWTDKSSESIYATVKGLHSWEYKKPVQSSFSKHLFVDDQERKLVNDEKVSELIVGVHSDLIYCIE